MKKFLTYDQGKVSTVQHKKPCSDCPFRKDAFPGWLGGQSIEEWLQMAHGETKIMCHVHLTQQCAGSACYRANVAKLPRDVTILRLGRTGKVFESAIEFKKHHERD